MAIKKNAFDLYTKNRKLPIKNVNEQVDLDCFDKDSVLPIQQKTCKNKVDLPLKYDLPVSEKKNFKTEVFNKNSDVSGERSFDLTHEIKPVKQPISTLNKKSIVRIQDGKNFQKDFHSLRGNKKKIIIAMYKNMFLNKTEITEELTLELIASLSGVNKKSLKNTLFRLSKDGLIKRIEQKYGCEGWVKYQFNPILMEQIKGSEDFFGQS